MSSVPPARSIRVGAEAAIMGDTLAKIGDMNAQPVVGLTARTLPLRSTECLRPSETVSRSYLEPLRTAGALTVILPNGDPDEAEAHLGLLDGLVLTGGDDPHPHLFGEEPHPRIEKVDERRDRYEIALVRGARRRRMPVLAICRGVQILNIALGGDIHQDIASQTGSAVLHAQRRLDDGPWHGIEVLPETVLGQILGPGRRVVNSFHHQACRRIGRGLRVCATSAGDGLIEALEDPDLPFFLGVQWHPELGAAEGDAGDRSLFAAFLVAARDRAGAASKESRSGR